MQFYNRLYDYIQEYFELVYKYYSRHAVAFLVNYYHISSEDSIWQTDKLHGGAYERVGDLSGIKYDKYLLMPVYFMEETQAEFEGTEEGYQKRSETNLVFPSDYDITPYAGDYVKFEQSYLRPINDTYPLYTVGGIQKSTNTSITFWKTSLYVEQSRTTNELDKQVNNIHVFFDYDKKFHDIYESESMTKLMKKNDDLRSIIKNKFYDSNSGFYLM